MNSYSVVSGSTDSQGEAISANGGRNRRKIFGRIGYFVVLLTLFLASAEITARLDDWCQAGIPIFANPNLDHDLFVKDNKGIQGRPHGQYKKWRLNQFGFRGPEVTVDPISGCRRIVVLGSSETFGLYESVGKEFPAQLATRLNHEGSYEVINASLPGMTIRSMNHYWETWVSQFRPEIVVVYPAPLFYLNDSFSREAGAKPQRSGIQPEAAPILQSRLVFRLKDTLHVPDFIQKWRTERQIEDLISGKDEDWFIRSMPQERLDLFAGDLAKLIDAIKKQGAQPVLLTHAIRTALPLRPGNFDDLHQMRVHLPRATETTLAEFESAAVAAVAAQGAKEDVPVIDVAAVMSGHREWFADLVHFNDEGAAVISGLVEEGIKGLCSQPVLNSERSRNSDSQIQDSKGS